MECPAARLGLAFVGWTRATCWAKAGFESLLPFEDFLSVRQQPIFKVRSRFEETADELHDAFLSNRGIDHDHQIGGIYLKTCRLKKVAVQLHTSWMTLRTC